MDAFECIRTKLDIRNYSKKRVPGDVKVKVLEAGRLTGSGVNRQHWRFILVQNPTLVEQLAKDSTSGAWVANADFAIVLLTDPRLGFYKLDAGRALQDMQLAAWNYGVVSCIYTGVNEEAMRKNFEIPEEFNISVVVSFGYPAQRVTGRRKNRKLLEEVAFLDTYGGAMDLHMLQ